LSKNESFSNHLRLKTVLREYEGQSINFVCTPVKVAGASPLIDSSGALVFLGFCFYLHVQDNEDDLHHGNKHSHEKKW
jgi:hypothetical protein